MYSCTSKEHIINLLCSKFEPLNTTWLIICILCLWVKVCKCCTRISLYIDTLINWNSSVYVALTLMRPPWLLVWPNTLSTVHSLSGKTLWQESLSPFVGCIGLHRLAWTKMSEKRKNILGLVSVPLGGTVFSQPSRIYQRPDRRKRREEKELTSGLSSQIH